MRFRIEGLHVYSAMKRNSNMKKIYLYCDTEFNGFGGELISMALVDPITRAFFYAEKVIKTPLHPWVQENVVSKLLGGEYVLDDKTFRQHLWEFLKDQAHDRHIVIVADWPEDLAHFANHMCSDHGQRPRINFTLELISSKHEQVTNPHFALSDAFDLAFWCVENNIPLKLNGE